VSGSVVSRRSLVLAGAGAGVLAATVLTGCDLDPGSSKPSAESHPDPDQTVVESARAELGLLIARLSVTPGAAALVECHRTQLAALAGTPPSASTPARPLRAAQVVAREHRAAERFTRWALTCRNGELARILASVAAGIQTQPLPRQAS